jgi:lipid A 3-O-deacylase
MSKAFTTVLAIIGCVVAAPSFATDTPGANLRDTKLFRFEFDNDTFLGSDDAFSAGWSVQVHSPMLDKWPKGLAGWIGRLPTLHDDGEGGRIVRWGWGITQLIVTPHDITIATPQPDDSPWAGALGGYVSWSSYDNDRLGALQMYLGCGGPCSHAEESQKFIHEKLNFGKTPEGWDNQLANKVLVNLNYEYRHKIWRGAERYQTRRFGQDASVGAQAGYGTFATYAEAWLEYRFGWDLPPGFTKLADPPAIGVALDPVYLAPDRPAIVQRTWRPYFNIVARMRYVRDFITTDGGRTENGGYYAPVVSTPGERQLIAGLHFAKLPLAFHLTYYRYFDNEVTSRVPDKLDWVNFSFERRF